MQRRTTAAGNAIEEENYQLRDRYYYDERLSQADGWFQYDTSQDASYFGIWVNAELRQVNFFSVERARSTVALESNFHSASSSTLRCVCVSDSS